MDIVDTSKSGAIEFEEFLCLIKGAGQVDENTEKIRTFFKNLADGKFGTQQISFSLLVQQMQRRNLKAAIMSDNP